MNYSWALIVRVKHLCVSVTLVLFAARTAGSSSDFIIVTAWHPHIVHSTQAAPGDVIALREIYKYKTLMSRTSSMKVLPWELQRLNCAGVTLSNKYPSRSAFIKLIFLYISSFWLRSRYKAWRRELRWWKNVAPRRARSSRQLYECKSKWQLFTTLSAQPVCQRNVSGHSRDN